MSSHPNGLAECPRTNNVCAIVVTCSPSKGFEDRLARTSAQVVQVVIVDNASQGEGLERVHAAALLPHVVLISNPGNLGIAAALNRGVSWARGHGFNWALLLDDDSVPQPDMLATLARAFDEFPEKDRLAVIGSNRILNPGDLEQRTRSGWWTISDAVITSGSLLELGAAQKIGPFREEFFMDFVDFEYCLRARGLGFKIVEVMVPTMQHFIGDRKTVRLLWFKVHEFNHRPWRSYYKIRNFMFVVRKYALKDPWWIFRMSWAMTKTMSVAIFIEESRMAKLRYTLLGLYDGLIGRVTRRVV